MRKTASRKGFYDEKEGLPDYKPNYEYVAKRTDTMTPKYEYMTGRQPIEKKYITANEDLYDYDHYVKQGHSHIYGK